MKILNNSRKTNYIHHNIQKSSTGTLTGLSLKDSFQESTKETMGLIPKTIPGVEMGKKEEIPWQIDQRPAIDLGTDSEGRKHIGNVRCGFVEAKEDKNWKPVFKELSVDPSKVKNAYLVIEPFAPEWIAGHALSYFEFEDGGVKTKDGKECNGLVVSIEARLKEGETYGLIKGMKNLFTNVYQVGTWQDYAQKAGRRRGHKLIRYKLNLNKEEQQAFLEKSIEDSLKDHSNDYYHTLKNSCYSNQIRMLNSILPEERKINEWLIPKLVKKPGVILPNAASLALGSRDITTDDPPIKMNPDKILHPDKQIKSSFIGQSLKSMSEMKAWEAMTGLTGMVAGAALCNLVLPPIVAIPVGGVIGGTAGVKIGEWIERETHYETESCEKYFKNDPPLQEVSEEIT